jgi:hypothetical protein
MHEHSDAAHFFTLLRVRRARPRHRHTAKKANELAPPHCSSSKFKAVIVSD